MERKLMLENATFCALSLHLCVQNIYHIGHTGFYLLALSFALFFQIGFFIKSLLTFITFYWNKISFMSFHVLFKVIMPSEFFVTNVANCFFLGMFFQVSRKVEFS